MASPGDWRRYNATSWRPITWGRVAAISSANRSARSAKLVAWSCANAWATAVGSCAGVALRTGSSAAPRYRFWVMTVIEEEPGASVSPLHPARIRIRPTPRRRAAEADAKPLGGSPATALPGPDHYRDLAAVIEVGRD